MPATLDSSFREEKELERKSLDFFAKIGRNKVREAEADVIERAKLILLAHAGHRRQQGEDHRRPSRDRKGRQRRPVRDLLHPDLPGEGGRDREGEALRAISLPSPQISSKVSFLSQTVVQRAPSIYQGAKVSVPAHSYSELASWVVFLEAVPFGEKKEPTIGLSLFRKTEAPYACGEGDSSKSILKKKAKGVVCDMEEWLNFTRQFEEAALCAAHLEEKTVRPFVRQLADRIVFNHPKLQPEELDLLFQRNDLEDAAVAIAEKVANGYSPTSERLVREFRTGETKRWVRMVLVLRMLKGVTEELDAQWKKDNVATPDTTEERKENVAPPERVSSREAKKRERKPLDKEKVAKTRLDMSSAASSPPMDLTRDSDADDIDAVPSSQSLI